MPISAGAIPSSTERTFCGTITPAAKTAIDDLADARVFAKELETGGVDAELAEWNIGRAQRRVETIVADDQKSARRSKIRDGFRIAKLTDDRERSNLIVRGGLVRRIWTDGGLAKGMGDRGRQSEFHIDVDGADAAQILVQFEDRLFASAVVFGRLITVLTRNVRGVVGWACMEPWDDPQGQLDSSIDAITKLQLGELAADQVDDLAVKLRGKKHVNPTLGALSSYLLRLLGRCR